MVKLFILFDNETIEKMKENTECHLSVVQDLQEYNLKVGILKCLDFKKQFGFIPIGYEMIECDNELFKVIQNQRVFFNAQIIDKKNMPKSIDWKEIFQDFPYIDKYIYTNNNFCVPYNRETDQIIHINI